MVVFGSTVLREEYGADAVGELREDVLKGLSQHPKEICAKYFYDDKGSGKTHLWSNCSKSNFRLL